MELTQVIKKPILTEKTTNLQQEKNVVTFEVDWAANQFQIKKAVEFIFKVQVEKINIVKVDKKPKRLGRFNGFTNRYKKAYVFLKEGSKINFYPEEEKKKTKKVVTKTDEEKAKEKSVEEKLKAKLAKKVVKTTEKEESSKTKTTKTASTANKKDATTKEAKSTVSAKKPAAKKPAAKKETK